MIRRLPLIPTLIVGLAVAVMIALGIWQLQRSEWKTELIARYQLAHSIPDEVSWPQTPAEGEAALYRRASVTCDRILDMEAMSGRSASGQTGWAQIAHCDLDGGGEGRIALGWSSDPRPPAWTAGEVSGFIAPAGDDVRLVADPAQAGLEQLARPDPRDLPNNHLAYAGQWFFFAGTAVVIYLLALRRRARGD